MATFRTMLRSIPPTDPIVVLCTSEVEPKELHTSITNDLFQFSRKNRALIDRPRLVGLNSRDLMLIDGAY